MSNLPLQPLVWETPLSGYIAFALSATNGYKIYADNTKYKLEYRLFGNAIREETGFTTIDEAKAWAWNHYNEKMQPYVKPMPTWIDVNERLPEDDGKYLVATSCGKQWMGNYNLPPKPNEWMLNGWSMNGGWHPFDITHWMPIPKLPSEADND